MQITRGGKLKARKGVNVPDIDAWSYELSFPTRCVVKREINNFEIC